MSKLSKTREIYREEGLASTLKTIFWYPHTRLRTHLPRGTNRYNEYQVPNARLFDRFNPAVATDLPAYEEILIEGIDRTATEGDNVVLIGGGNGISSVAVAERIGESGRVYSFEASEKRYERMGETAELNGMGEIVVPIHAFVGDAIDVEGTMGNADEIHPKHLPHCELLVMDAQGAGCEILRNMTVRPDRVVIETHGFLGCSTGTVRSLLESFGYTVENLGPAMQSRGEETMIERDVYILIGRM